MKISVILTNLSVKHLTGRIKSFQKTLLEMRKAIQKLPFPANWPEGQQMKVFLNFNN
jgi:hypothetical protein